MCKKFFNFFIVLSLFSFIGCGSEKPKPKPQPKPLPLPRPKPKPLPKDPKPETKSCVLEGESFDGNGSYKFQVKKVGDINVYEPITDGKCTRPIYSHSNGTGSRSIFYTPQLTRMASHGFLAVSFESTNTGSGVQSLQAVEWALGQDMIESKVAFGGHSQGGGSAAAAHFLAQNKYGDSLQIISILEEPAFGMNRLGFAVEVPQLRGSTFVIHGSRDSIVPKSWVARGAKLLTNDHYWYEAVGANHINVRPWSAAGTVSFAKWKFYGMADAKNYFLELMPSSEYWKAVEISQRANGFSPDLEYELILREEYELYK